MISPLPFFGPVGAVRVGRIEGEFVLNPTHQQNFEESTLDLIVVGTKDGLTMVEAGADEVPEDVLLEALELAHAEIRKLCEAQEDLRRQAGKAKWLDLELTAEIEGSHGHTIWERIQQDGLREAASIETELLAELAPELSMDSNEEDILRQLQVGRASRCCSRSSGSPRSRPRCGSSSSRTCGRSPTRSTTRRSSSPRSGTCSSTGSSTRPSCRSRSARRRSTATRPTVKDSLTKSYVKKAAEAIYKDLVRKKIAIDKRRPDGRGAEEIRPIECEVTVSPARARLGALPARADAGPDAC